MRPILFLLPLFALLTGCGTRTQQTDTADSDSAALSTNRTITTCYRQVQGTDTTRLRLDLNGTSVTGELAVLPAEKDRATGTLTGTLVGNQIRADWQRSGEGVTQVYDVQLTLMDSTVSWREGERTDQNGKWVLKNPDQSYEYVLTKVDCP